MLAVRRYAHRPLLAGFFDTNKAITETFGAAGYPVPEAHMARRQKAA